MICFSGSDLPLNRIRREAMKDNAYIIKKMFRGSLMVMILATLTATLGMVIDGILIGS